MKTETYYKKSVSQLDGIAWRHFSKFIRERDSSGDFFICISCGKPKPKEGNLQAGHYFPAGKFKAIKYDEHNCNGECLACNYYSGDHLIGYKKNLIKKIGEEAFELLEIKAADNKRRNYKLDKFWLISTIEKYRNYKFAKTKGIV